MLDLTLLNLLPRFRQMVRDIAHEPRTHRFTHHTVEKTRLFEIARAAGFGILGVAGVPCSASATSRALESEMGPPRLFARKVWS